MLPSVDTSIVWSFLALWLVVVPTPGANSLMVTHVALTSSRRNVLLAISGNMLGIGFWPLCAALGLAVLLEAAPNARLTLNVLGGAYLVWFGVRLIVMSFRHGAASSVSTTPMPALTAWRAFALGTVTALANTQAVFFITSIFAVAGVTSASFATSLACILVMIGCNAIYLALLGGLLQRPAVRMVYERIKRPLERLVGSVFILFGLRLALRPLLAR